MAKKQRAGARGLSRSARPLHIAELKLPAKPPKSGMKAFVLISLAVHLFLLGGTGLITAKKKSGVSGEYLEVNFSYLPKKQAFSAKKEEKYTVNTNSGEGIDVKKTSEEKAASVESEQERASFIEAIGPEQMAFVDPLTVWKAVVRERIRKALRYPKILREMNIEGTATVDFTINKAGTPMNIIISGSSGVKTLDDSAVRTVSRAAPFPSPLDFGEEKYTVSIPIAFKLSDLN